MRSLRQIKKLISHARVESKPQADQTVLRHLLAEFATVAGNAPLPCENETLSAADLLTVGGLNAAYRRGGLEAVDRQCEAAARRLEDQPQRISVPQLIRQLNGT
jgi:hypothetical protein